MILKIFLFQFQSFNNKKNINQKIEQFKKYITLSKGRECQAIRYGQEKKCR